MSNHFIITLMCVMKKKGGKMFVEIKWLKSGSSGPFNYSINLAMSCAAEKLSTTVGTS